MPYLKPVMQGFQQTHVYNLEQAVGENSPNAREDVRLVQVMLLGLYGARAAGLVADGWIGPTTIAWIKRFQEHASRAGNNVLVDGRMDRAFGDRSSVSKTAYSITLLNLYLRKTNPAYYAAVPQMVAMSANPRANPYNPEPLNPWGKPWSLTTVDGDLFTVIYEDGTTESYVLRLPPNQQLYLYGEPLQDGVFVPGPDGKLIRVGSARIPGT